MLTTIIVFFLILGIIVLVHEAGHFFVARQGGIRVEEFGLGIPPRAIGFIRDDSGKWKKVPRKTPAVEGKTIWSLNWLPLGGFVKIMGEEGGNKDNPESFSNKSIGRRIAVLSAGVTMNLVLAIVLLTAGLMIGSPQVLDEANLPASANVKDVQIRIVEVLPDSPAATAGIELRDTVLDIDGQSFAAIADLQEYVNTKADQTIVLNIDREGENLALSVVPQTLEETDSVAMGVALVQTGLVSYPWYIAWWYGIVQTFEMVVAIISGFGLMIASLFSAKEVVGEVYGPIGIAGLVGDAIDLGYLYVIQFTAVLSIIIAVINYVPFPALDGGRVLFLIIEALRGKPMKEKTEAALHNSGFALLMLLILIVTFNDIARVSGGFFSNLF